MLSAPQYVDEIPIPSRFSADNFRSALKYKPTAEDIFVVTYPKCGTTWAGRILLLLLQKGEPVQASDLKRKAFLEVVGAETVERMPRPGVIASHLPFHLMPWSDEAKYIYVTRNPKDCCVSLFHYSKHLPSDCFQEGTFEEVFQYFMSGLSKSVYFGDYFDHLLSWYAHRDDPNVLFLTYEEMKEDIDGAIFKMASFVDDEKYAKELRKNPEILEKIKKNSSLKEMKGNMSILQAEIAHMTLKEFLESAAFPDTMKEYLVSEDDKKTLSAINLSERFNLISKLVRKGEIGDWRNYFSEDQNRQMEEKFFEKTELTDIPIMWRKFMK